jgi:hypothetical protein
MVHDADVTVAGDDVEVGLMGFAALYPSYETARLYHASIAASCHHEA